MDSQRATIGGLHRMSHQKPDRIERLKQERGMGGASDDDLWRKLEEERNTLYGTNVGTQLRHERDAQSLALRNKTGRKLILVREDNDLNCVLFRNILEISLQCVTIVTKDGDEALEVARLHAPDLIQSDILGPTQSGLDFARLVKKDERTKHIPLICVSAWGGKDDAVLAAGFDAYMPKPINVHKYLDLIDFWLSIML
jgi:two-component system cell cycle response regulator DivK